MRGTLRGRSMAVFVGAATWVAAGCRSDEPRMQGALPDTLPPVGEMAPGAGAGLADPQAALRHADALDALSAEMHTHIRQMRLLSPREARPRMGEHEARVTELLDGADRELRGAAAGMTDEQLSNRLGLAPDRFALLQEEKNIAREEARALRGASEVQVRERIEGHLDRLERVATTLESAAAQLRRPGNR
jgi:hypothetical protein